jgi:hypothetical protein
MITSTRFTSVTERTAVMAMMVSVAMTPIYVAGPACMCVPPARIITPIPRTVPSVPCVAPEPIVDQGPINIYGFYDVVRTIYILVANYLNGNLILLIFLHVYRGYVLEDILCQNRLQNDESLVTLTRFHNADVIHLSVTVQVQVTERTVRVVEHRLELFQVFSICEQFSYHLQIESFRDVRTLGGDRDCLLCPQRCTHQHQRHQKCS